MTQIERREVQAARDRAGQLLVELEKVREEINFGLAHTLALVIRRFLDQAIDRDIRSREYPRRRTRE